MDAGSFLIALVAGAFGLAALLGLGWLIERPLGSQVRAWVRQLLGERERRK
ncbi:hypothetical protein [Microlunatus speluncae]|uniref:hypothetical protein n=1 Tax=Microlunatus speluncae TaxID=2594267 RepID=UPI0013761258|nr:hypothetical protein [Microlunatus speluncae]